MVSGKAKITCSSCGKEKDAARDFYTSFSPFHKSTGRLHVCKHCLSESVKENDIKSFANMLRAMDKPMIMHLYESAIQSNAYVGEYFKLVNAKDFRNMTWDDSDFEGHKGTDSIKKNNLVDEDEVKDISQDEYNYLRSFWGKSFDLEELLWLQEEYEDFTNRYECDSKGMELLIKQICLTELDIENRRTNGEKVDTQLKTLQDLLGSGNLKPVQETGANAVEQETFGTLIKKFEREKPIPEPDPTWKDVDGIGKYIRTFFFGHMAKAIGAENKFQTEYEEEFAKYTVNQEDVEDGELNE